MAAKKEFKFLPTPSSQVPVARTVVVDAAHPDGGSNSSYITDNTPIKDPSKLVIDNPHANDVLCCRGFQAIYLHEGNIWYQNAMESKTGSNFIRKKLAVEACCIKGTMSLVKQGIIK